MFVAVAFSNQLRSCVPEVGSKLEPLALRRLRLDRNDRSVGPINAWPFLFDQKPSVSPPPAPRHTLPKFGPATLAAFAVAVPEVAVVFCHTPTGNQPTGANSLIVYTVPS